MYVKRGQMGFSLLEVLVALLVLSIGMIGLASLQLTDVKNNRDAYYRTQAIILSNNMAERMRANLEGVQDQSYDAINGSLYGSCRTTTGCTAAELAGDDVYLWRDTVTRVLPDGDAIVCIDSDPDTGTRVNGVTTPDCDGVGNIYVTKIWWDDDRDVSTENQRLSMAFSP